MVTNVNEDAPVKNATFAQLRVEAMHRYGDGNDVVIDSNARVSWSEYGAFVQAWVWVTHENALSVDKASEQAIRFGSRVSRKVQ